MQNKRKSAMSSIYHSGMAENSGVGVKLAGEIFAIKGPSIGRDSIWYKRYSQTVL